ncbi:hypothetical protein VTN77DRAFT_1284 [Rasamsonia byssochlamydoides]|uniref:uncharacterized protein n=1 Tax=Rasamsonia byssochlamydoides TaxID=89139 RepID=UPI00374385A3
MTMAVTTTTHPNSTFWQSYREPLSPTARIAISSPRYSISSGQSWDDYVDEEEQDVPVNASKLKASAITTPSRPWSRGSNSKSIRKTKSSLPAYTNANPFLYRVSAHSFTHSWPTHKLVPCPRCNAHGEQHEVEPSPEKGNIHSSSSLSRNVLARYQSSTSSSSSSLLGYEPDELFDF